MQLSEETDEACANRDRRKNITAQEVDIDMLKVMNWLLFARDYVTLKNCFRKAGFKTGDCETEVPLSIMI